MTSSDSSERGSPGSDSGAEGDRGLDFEGYTLLHELSRGGQAIVFSALQKSTGRKVAIKFFPGGVYATRTEKARMEREIRVLAALDHPNIVSVIDRGQTPDGSSYFVLEYVHGKTLSEFIDELWEDRGSPREPGDLEDVLRLFIGIADAVNAAHLRGIVHRDLKPSNIVIDGYGEPHILDFGVALSMASGGADEEPGQPVTWTGEFLGSMQWASPEQAEGNPSRVDVRSDVYSLGVMLYEMLTGDFPYEVFGTIPDILQNIMHARPRPPSEVVRERPAANGGPESSTRSRDADPIPPELDAIVLKALAKKRDDRFQSAGEFSRALNQYLSGKASLLHAAPSRKTLSVTTAAMSAGAAVLLAAVAGAVYYLGPGKDGGPGAPAMVFEMPYDEVYGYRLEGDAVVFEFDPRDYDLARMADGTLGRVGDVGSVDRVTIAGLFNDWNPRDRDWMMVPVARNRFELRKPLELFEGRYEWPFKFVINERVWVSAPVLADNREVVIEDTATHNLLLVNPLEQEAAHAQALREYRQGIDRLWPGQGENLVMDGDGRFHLTLTHVEQGARMRSLEPLQGIPLTSLNIGEVRVGDFSPLREMETLRWFVCNEATYNAVFFAMNNALRAEDYETAMRELEDILGELENVPALARTRLLFMESLEGMQALLADPESIPEQARVHEGRYYLLILTPMPWAEARAYAEAQGATLAAVPSEDVQEWMTETFGWPTLGRHIWIGATDEMVRGSWGWLTAEPWLFEHWAPGHPARDDERARFIAMQYDGWWRNLDGDAHRFPSLIEWRK